MANSDPVEGIFSEESLQRAYVAAGLRSGESIAAFTRDLSALAEADRLNDVFGRETEIDAIARTLKREQSPSVILTGKPGVGKTALVEAFALRLRTPGTPLARRNPELANARIVELILSQLSAGTAYVGTLEERVTHILRTLRESAGTRPIILFIDEIHTIFSVGGVTGAISLKDMLKSEMAAGTMRIIGATTSYEYAVWFRKDPAFKRRLAVVAVSEPSASVAARTLDSAPLRERVERAFHVTYDATLAQHVAARAGRFLVGRAFPSKAIDTLTGAASATRNTADNVTRGSSYYNKVTGALMWPVRRGDPTLGHAADDIRIAYIKLVARLVARGAVPLPRRIRLQKADFAVYGTRPGTGTRTTAASKDDDINVIVLGDTSRTRAPMLAPSEMIRTEARELMRELANAEKQMRVESDAARVTEKRLHELTKALNTRTELLHVRQTHTSLAAHFVAKVEERLKSVGIHGVDLAAEARVSLIPSKLSATAQQQASALHMNASTAFQRWNRHRLHFAAKERVLTEARKQLRATLSESWNVYTAVFEAADATAPVLGAYPRIDAITVDHVVAERANVPFHRLGADQSSRLPEVEQRLRARIVGQSRAIDALLSSLRVAFAGLEGDRGSRPIASFLLMGPPGVGKTLFAEVVGEVLFDSDVDSTRLIRLNMNEYSTPDRALEKLIGSGADVEGASRGELTDALRAVPFALILADEIEKADRSVQDWFMQAIARGEARDAFGEILSFRETIIVMTSNVLSDDIIEAFATLEPATHLARFYAAAAKNEDLSFASQLDEPLTELTRYVYERVDASATPKATEEEDRASAEADALFARAGKSFDDVRTALDRSTRLAALLEEDAYFSYSRDVRDVLHEKLERGVPADEGVGGGGGGALVFRPEFVNRFSNTLIFTPLTRNDLRRIVSRQYLLLLARLGMTQRTLPLAPRPLDLFDYIINASDTGAGGARDVLRKWSAHVANAIALNMLPDATGKPLPLATKTAQSAVFRDATYLPRSMGEMIRETRPERILFVEDDSQTPVRVVSLSVIVPARAGEDESGDARRFKIRFTDPSTLSVLQLRTHLRALVDFSKGNIGDTTMAAIETLL